ncbi:hypothetical protein [Roseimaritima sediminicola]|uniref:hypothetical protein n=1 Tax=Roseimaritima sediminicola TaxID=2662066 RepID=UPI001298470C|nr:hypothetical protein [Roseimaritima sediminicola]
MSNPYQPTSQPLEQDPAAQARREVTPPAIALLVVASIGLGVGILGLIGDVAMLVTGMVARLEAMNQGPVSEYVQLAIRSAWGVLLILVDVVIIRGALGMKRLWDYDASKRAAILSVIPCIGPCCLLGIPFGIWALVVLNRPHVRTAFR